MTDNTDRLTLQPGTVQTPEQQIEYWYEKWETTFEELGQQINATSNVYRERAALVALLAAIYPATWNYGDDEAAGWPIIYIDLPNGQATWHVSENDMTLFEHVERDDTTIWDGHTTDEKYQRIAELAAQPAATAAGDTEG